MSHKRRKIPWGDWVCTLLRLLSIDCRRIQGPYVPYREAPWPTPYHRLR